MLYIYIYIHIIIIICMSVFSSTFGNLPACTIFLTMWNMGFPLEHPGCVPGEFALWKGFVVATEWLSPEISRGHGLLGSTWLWPSQVWPLISLFVRLKSTFHWMSRSESRRIRSFFGMIFIDFLYFSITSYPISPFFGESWSHGDPRNRSAQMGIWRFPKF